MQSFMKRKIKINFVLICTALEKNIDCLMKRLFRQKVIINISACSHPSQFSIIQSIRSIQFCNFSFTMKSTFFLRNGVFPSLSSHCMNLHQIISLRFCTFLLKITSFICIYWCGIHSFDSIFFRIFQNISIFVVLVYAWRISMNMKKSNELGDVYWGKFIKSSYCIDELRFKQILVLFSKKKNEQICLVS